MMLDRWKSLPLFILLLATALTVAAAPSPAVLEAESQRIAVMDKAKSCVLAVFSPNGQGGGSGVVVTPDGYALSNFHVVQPCGKAMQCGMADGRVYDAVIVGIDPVGDVALIKLFGRDDFPCAETTDSDRVRAGNWVFAMGNPFLLATDMQPTVTYGIVSGVHRYQFPSGTLLEYTDCLQIDASINPGNSGGPLFDARGLLIGINGRASFEKRGRVNVGAAYAISINQIKNFLGVLRGGRIADHATLGARVNADADGRVVVAEVLETSDAYRRGLRYDDEIFSFGGRQISTPNGFKNALGIYPKGWRVPLSYRRDGRRYDILVRLAGVHGQEELIEKATARPMPAVPKPVPKPDKKQSPKENPQPPQGEPPMPEIAKKHFAEKRGYANYYFNALEQKRIAKAWLAQTNPQGIKGPWTLIGQKLLPSPAGKTAGGEGNGAGVDGKTAGGEGVISLPSPSGRGAGGEGGDAIRFRLTNNSASLKLQNKDINWTAGDNLGASLLPANSGGLLPALYLWRRLAVEGIERFGDVFYDGAAPLPGHAGLVDVLVGSHKGVECRFYFNPADGRLLALEMFSGEDADPCEIYFSDYRESAGRSWPGKIEVRYGDAPFATFKLTEVQCEK
jgi:serine protease Do